MDRLGGMSQRRYLVHRAGDPHMHGVDDGAKPTPTQLRCEDPIELLNGHSLEVRRVAQELCDHCSSSFGVGGQLHFDDHDAAARLYTDEARVARTAGHFSTNHQTVGSPDSGSSCGASLTNVCSVASSANPAGLRTIQPEPSFRQIAVTVQR